MRAVLAGGAPDIVLVDASAESALDSIGLLRSLAPFSRIIVWTEGMPPEIALKTIPLGVRGVVLKAASIAAVVRCVTSVSQGELWFDKSLFCCSKLPLPESELLARGLAS